MVIVSNVASQLVVALGLDWIDHYQRQIVMEEVHDMEEEKQQIQSLIRQHQSENFPTELPCLMILREKLSAVLDDEELQFLNFEELNHGTFAFEQTIRRSRMMVSYLRMEDTNLVFLNVDLISPLHKFEMSRGEYCSNSVICTRNSLVSESLVDQNNLTSSRFSLVNYLTSVHFTQHWRGRSFTQRDPITIQMGNSCIQNRRKENLRRFSTSLTTLTFPLFLFSTMFSHPFERQQGSHSLLLTLFTLFNFVGFVSAASVMILVQARFTLIQIIVLLISTMALNIWSSNFFIFTLVSIPILALLCVVWCLHTNSSPS